MATLTVPAVALPAGETIPKLGQGTWHLGEGRHPAKVETVALRLGLDLGMTLVDTAETYADGETERFVGRAIADRRDEVFLVSKVAPAHATREGAIAACEASLRRLATDRLDMYLLHWRGPVPLTETVDGFEELRSRGLIRHWGVSNFDVADLAELAQVRAGDRVQSDQVLYNLTRRGIEWDLLPWCQQAGLPVMAYSPIEQGRLLGHPVLRGVGTRHRATSAQIALAWVLAHAGVCAIPEAGTPEHVAENRRALDIRLGPDDLLELDSAFEPPPGPRPLEML